MKDQNLLISGLRDEGRAAIEWASSQEAKAQFRAAMGVARRLGSTVTGTELSAMLWAAHNARPIAEPGDGKTRVKRELMVNAEGDDDGELPRTFQLGAWDYPEKMFRGSWTRNGPGTRTIFTGGITRRELEALLTEGISWLAWDGSNG